MNFSHYIYIYGIRVLVNLDINVDALANDLGAKAAGNCNGKATVRFGNIKASIGGKDMQALTAANGARAAARKQRASGSQQYTRVNYGADAGHDE